MKQLISRERQRQTEIDRETETDRQREKQRERQRDSHKDFIFRKIIAFWLEKLHASAEVFNDWYFLDQPLN